MTFEDCCPVCGGSDIDWDTTDIQGEMKIESFDCYECDSQWERVWVFLENRNVQDARL